MRIALNRYAVGSRPADREVATARSCGRDSLVEYSFLNIRLRPDSDRTAVIAACLKCAGFGHASLYRREPRQAGHCDLRTVFPKVISGLRRPIAIQAAISLNMNLPE